MPCCNETCFIPASPEARSSSCWSVRRRPSRSLFATSPAGGGGRSSRNGCRQEKERTMDSRQMHKIWSDQCGAAEYRHLLGPASRIVGRETDLVLRKEAGRRIEKQHGAVRAGTVKGPIFQQSHHYHEVQLSGLVFHLGQVQARIIKTLEKA